MPEPLLRSKLATWQAFLMNDMTETVTGIENGCSVVISSITLRYRDQPKYLPKNLVIVPHLNNGYV